MRLRNGFCMVCGKDMRRDQLSYSGHTPEYRKEARLRRRKRLTCDQCSDFWNDEVRDIDLNARTIVWRKRVEA